MKMDEKEVLFRPFSHKRVWNNHQIVDFCGLLVIVRFKQANLTPYISICIPAYKRSDYLRRLFASIKVQTYTDFEVVVTDDSPDDEVKNLCNEFQALLPIAYHKNETTLGTPENWNESIRKAKGQWIKLMHDDDWFADEHALAIFEKNIKAHPECQFFFSAFTNIVASSNAREVVRCSYWDLCFLKISPLHLFKKVYVGNPSCTIIRKDIGEYYDRRFKFVVDFEYYIRCFDKCKYHYIDALLLDIGFHEGQVTQYTFMVPSVQIPENMLLLQKLGVHILKNPVVYDYYWRLLRNLNMRSLADIASYYPDTKAIPTPLLLMLKQQSAIQPSRLKNGFLSKIFMLLSYLRFRWQH